MRYFISLYDDTYFKIKTEDEDVYEDSLAFFCEGLTEDCYNKGYEAVDLASDEKLVEFFGDRKAFDALDRIQAVKYFQDNSDNLLTKENL